MHLFDIFKVLQLQLMNELLVLNLGSDQEIQLLKPKRTIAINEIELTIDELNEVKTHVIYKCFILKLRNKTKTCIHL